MWLDIRPRWSALINCLPCVPSSMLVPAPCLGARPDHHRAKSGTERSAARKATIALIQAPNRSLIRPYGLFQPLSTARRLVMMVILKDLVVVLGEGCGHRCFPSLVVSGNDRLKRKQSEMRYTCPYRVSGFDPETMLQGRGHDGVAGWCCRSALDVVLIGFIDYLPLPVNMPRAECDARLGAICSQTYK
jgi:hypothetical protein